MFRTTTVGNKVIGPLKIDDGIKINTESTVLT